MMLAQDLEKVRRRERDGKRQREEESGEESTEKGDQDTKRRNLEHVTSEGQPMLVGSQTLVNMTRVNLAELVQTLLVSNEQLVQTHPDKKNSSPKS